jgi:hypothetical protein
MVCDIGRRDVSRPRVHADHLPARWLGRLPMASRPRMMVIATYLGASADLCGGSQRRRLIKLFEPFLALLLR